MSKSERIVRAGLPDLLARLWRYALVLTKDAEAAERLTQATVEKAVEKASSYKIGTRLASWCFALMSALRRQEMRAQPNRQAQKSSGLPQARLTKYPELPAAMQKLYDYVLTLPEAQRVTVFLVYVEGYKYREAAEQLGVPVGTVMNRLSASRKTLNSLIDPRKQLPDGEAV